MSWELASYPAGLAAVDPEALVALAAREPALAGLEVAVAGPGEPVRVTHVLDAVEPRARPDGRPAFPTSARAGEGRTNRVDGVVVLSCLDFPGEERPLHEQEGVVDLAGPGADVTPFRSLTNVVLVFAPAPGAPHAALDEAVRRVTLAAAELLAAPTLGAEPAEVERFELGPAPGLPRVAALVQLSDLGQLYVQRVYGVPAGEAGLPRAFDPAELLDGAVTAGEYHWASMRNPTFFHQRSLLVRSFYREHGRRLDFAGLVLMRGYEQTAADKERAAAAAAGVARDLGAVGVVIATDAGGNSHTDVMLTVRACERLGIRTVAIVAEQNEPTSTDPALVDWVPEADSIVSVGNSLDLVPAWTPERVLGGETLLDGRSAYDAGPIPVQDYLGATSQVGQLDLTARTW